MIELATSNASLDLQNDAKITIKQKSSLFTILEKEDKQSYSYPFTLPLSSNNNRVISNILEQEKEETLKTILRANGVRLFKADLRITERTNKNYEVALQLNKKVDLFNRKLNSLYSQLGTFFITDSTRYVDLFFFITDFILIPANYQAKVEIVVSGITYNITASLDQITTALANAINADSINNNATAIANNMYELRIEEVNTSLPFFAYSQNWSTRLDLGSGFGVPYGFVGLFPYPKNVVTNKSLATTHANTIDALADFRDSPYCFPHFFVEMRNDQSFFNYVTINAFDVVTQEYRFYLYSVFLPNIRLTALIEKVLNVAGWKLESNFLKDIEIEKLFILNPYAIAEIAGPDWDIQQYLQFFLADCLPDISFVELIEELKKIFCLNVNYDHTSKILKIETANASLSNKLAKDYECTPNFSEKVKEKNKGYILKYNTDLYKQSDTESNTSLLDSKTIGEGKTEITSNFPFLPTYLVETDEITYPFLPDGLKMPSSFAAYGYVRGFELFITKKFWLKEGIVKSINFMSYVDRQAKLDTQNYSLTWESLYNEFWEKYLNLLDNADVEREIIFTFSELQGIDLTELIRLEYSNYFIKEIEYTLTNNEQFRILTKVKLIKTI